MFFFFQLQKDNPYLLFFALDPIAGLVRFIIHVKKINIKIQDCYIMKILNKITHNIQINFTSSLNLFIVK